MNYFSPFLDKKGFEHLCSFEGGGAVKPRLSKAVGFRSHEDGVFQTTLSYLVLVTMAHGM